VLDLGAAPGSWTQFSATRVGPHGLVVAVDLTPMSAHAGNVVGYTGDFYDADVLRAIASHGPYNVLLSDAAPATTGNRSLDTTRSAAIAEHALYLCGEFLNEGGHVVVKIFQGGEEQALLKEFRRLFQTGRLFKPKACRAESFETYLIGLGYRRPESQAQDTAGYCS